MKKQRELLAQAPVSYQHPTETTNEEKRKKERRASTKDFPYKRVTLRLIPQQLRILVLPAHSFCCCNSLRKYSGAGVENTDALLELYKKKISTGKSRMTSREGPDSEITRPQRGQAPQPDRG